MDYKIDNNLCCTEREKAGKLPTFVVIGGDCRQNFLASRLASLGYEVFGYGLSGEQDAGGTKLLGDIRELRVTPDVVVLPLIASEDGIYVNMPFCGDKLALSAVADLCTDKSIVVGGHMTGKVTEEFEAKNIPTADYFNREELIIKNCIPTAEGALMLAMENTGGTIFGSRILITGFGRVSKATARLFAAVGAKVTIAARKSSDLALAQTLGYEAIDISKLSNFCGGFDVIINTVPSLVIGANELKNVNSSALIIDLASKPGGIDIAAASLLKIKFIWALSLPPKGIDCESPAGLFHYLQATELRLSLSGPYIIPPYRAIVSFFLF